MDEDRLEHKLIIYARAVYANYVLTMVGIGMCLDALVTVHRLTASIRLLRIHRFIGIHIFMALYGLSVFLETPMHLRKGRKRYIAASFVITALSTLTGSLDMAGYFPVLFQATSGRTWRELRTESGDHWESKVSMVTIGCILISDVLLVSRLVLVS